MGEGEGGLRLGIGPWTMRMGRGELTQLLNLAQLGGIHC